MSESIHPAIWFLCGSQHLYGPDTLAQVDEHARTVAAGLNEAAGMPLGVGVPVIAPESAMAPAST